MCRCIPGPPRLARGTGAIFSGTLGTAALSPFIAGTVQGTPPPATGLKVRRGLVYVAGASTGQIRVCDLANPTAAPKVFNTGGGFINDLDLDEHGNVFATDSTRSTIFEVTAEQVAAGTGTPQAIDVSSGITSDTSPGAFNPQRHRRPPRRPNASFTAGPTNGNFTVTGMARNAIRHGGGGRHTGR